jgi:hypothetical protein
MKLRFRQRPVAVHDATRDAEHDMTSEFSVGQCRFVITCTCGASFDTPYIDEALEIRELHLAMAPLVDQLAP